jgi:hypothetical protein
MELLAVGWNLPALKARLTNVHARFRAIFEYHFGQALCHYGLDENQYPLKAIVAAVTSFQLGLIVEGLSDVHEGHQELLDWIQGWVDDLEAQAAKRPVVPHPDRPPPSSARRKRRKPGAAEKRQELGA